MNNNNTKPTTDTQPDAPAVNSPLSTVNSAPPPAVTCPPSLINCTSPWTDADYQLFVDQLTTGAYPEACNDPTAWDDHFVLAHDPDAPFRPTVISSADFNAHLPAVHHDSYGLLVLKLWEVARSKGYTAEFEQQQHRARLQRKQQEEELRQHQLRGEIDALKHNLPEPEPLAPVDPRQQWYAAIMAAALPDSTLIQKVKHVQKSVIEGQPFRSAILTDSAAEVLSNTYGPIMFPESDDALKHPIEPEREPEPVPTRWSPKATSREIVNGAARDLADLVSLLIARQKVSVGFAADHKTIQEVHQLTRSLRHLTQIVRETDPRKPGPKPKSQLNADN